MKKFFSVFMIAVCCMALLSKPKYYPNLTFYCIEYQ